MTGFRLFPLPTKKLEIVGFVFVSEHKFWAVYFNLFSKSLNGKTLTSPSLTVSISLNPSLFAQLSSPSPFETTMETETYMDSMGFKVQELLKEVRLEHSPAVTKLVDDTVSSIKAAIDKIPEDLQVFLKKCVYSFFYFYFFIIGKGLIMKML